jgi:hypothetical protein
MTLKERRLLRMLAEVLEITEARAAKRKTTNQACQCLEMEEFLCHLHIPRWKKLREQIRKELAGGPN